MIRIAHQCGADIIKGQAFRGEDIRGSMPLEFYQQCAFSIEQYLDLIDFARDIGNDLFYSIFSTGSGFSAIAAKQSWRKIAASQTRSGMLTMADDAENCFVSVPLAVSVPRFKKATMLHVTDYLASNPQLWHIETLTEFSGQQAGYSDHTIGIDACVRAHHEYGASVIEKHFTLERNLAFNGTVYRDTVHGATPNELSKLARELSQ